MRTRPALAAAAASLTVLLTATGASAAVSAPDSLSAPAAATCGEGSVTVTATRSDAADTVRISVTNKSGRACVVDRIPTVTFGDLDGAAQPVPPVESSPYRLAAGGSAYASVRTVDPSAEAPRTVAHLTVAGDPSHHGTRFDGASLGSPGGIEVWEPVTTLWQPTRAKADAALAAATR
ncbi:DUF4232 domain-containing protein [Streptomyces sp. NPDC088116]|uniref:DUF4232 domain-containing protein n=1 Tax=Streptomyces sp. NPDC088116 TaxID=3365825 RepID=UPI00380D527C